MGAAEMIEEQVKKYGGRYADELIQLVRELAENDIRIKREMDEIERLDGDLIQRHNELADKINELVDKSVEASEEDEVTEAVTPGEGADHGRDLDIKMEIRITGRMVLPDCEKQGAIDIRQQKIYYNKTRK